MMAFHLLLLKELTQKKKLAQVTDQRVTQILCIEFFGARLSCCSSLQYLGSSGLVYYSSKSGDSFIL